MAQYRYNGQVVVKNSRREDFEYACIYEKEDGKIVKVQISSTFDGAGVEKRRRISEHTEGIENCRRAIKAFEDGKDTYYVQIGRYSERRSITWYKGSGWLTVSDEERAMNPVEYYNHRIEEHMEAIEWLKNHWIIVKVEKI